eukprot:62534_1
MRTLVFILLLFISNDGRPSCVCPSGQCCLPPAPCDPTQQCTSSPTQSKTPAPSREYPECLEDIHDCWHKYVSFCCIALTIAAFIGLLSGMVIHKYCNCGKYCSKEN